MGRMLGVFVYPMWGGTAHDIPHTVGEDDRVAFTVIDPRFFTQGLVRARWTIQEHKGERPWIVPRGDSALFWFLK